MINSMHEILCEYKRMSSKYIYEIIEQGFKVKWSRFNLRKGKGLGKVRKLTKGNKKNCLFGSSSDKAIEFPLIPLSDYLVQDARIHFNCGWWQQCGGGWWEKKDAWIPLIFLISQMKRPLINKYALKV